MNIFIWLPRMGGERSRARARGHSAYLIVGIVGTVPSSWFLSPLVGISRRGALR
jgi:hypothetical protein